jgi:hypothetical protein
MCKLSVEKGKSFPQWGKNKKVSNIKDKDMFSTVSTPPTTITKK